MARTRKLSAGRPRAEQIASWRHYGLSASFPSSWSDGFSANKAEREHAAKTGAAMPDGSFPIEACKGENSVESAKGLARTDAQRKHVIKRAESLGCKELIPDTWNDDGSKKESSDSAEGAAFVEDEAEDKAGPERHLIKWFKDGADGKIHWGEPGDFDDCVKVARPHLENPEGFCQERHIEATGEPAGKAAGEDKHSRVTAALAAAEAAEVDTDDDKVLKALEAAKRAVEEAVAAQGEDPDAETDPNDTKVNEALTALEEAVKAAVAAQEADSKADAGHTAAGAPPVREGSKKDGKASEEIDPNSVCANCQHPAGLHEDTERGPNSGGCTAEGCDCDEFATKGAANEGGSEGDEADEGDEGDADEGQQNGRSGAHALADEPVPADVPPSPSAAPHAPPQATEAPAVDVPSENMGPAFTIPVAVIEGEDTGDGRSIQPGALTWRNPPLPLMGMNTSAHDPMGMDPNDPAVICGRIDTIERKDGPTEGTQVLVCKGYFLSNEDGLYFADLVESMGRVGVSADIAIGDSEIQIQDVDDMGFPEDVSETLTSGVLMAVTVVPQPAFAGCYIVLGDGSSQPAPVPQAAEPAPATEEEAQTASARPHFMSYHECEPCQSGVDVITASGGPLAPPAAWFKDPKFTVGDGRLVEILDRRGHGGKYAAPLTVEDDGRIYGHIAPWGVCHSGFSNACVLAPKSKTGYAHFKRAQHVLTAEGEKVRVGVLTLDAGHASVRGISASQAMAHYDNTALAIADVNIGEDEFGIWIAGAVRPDATPEQIRKLRAASVSGDWRNMGDGLELVAALCVNQPGYPLAQVASGQLESLVASGAPTMARLKRRAPEPDEPDSLVAALQPLLDQTASRSRDALQPLRDGKAARARARLKALR